VAAILRVTAELTYQIVVPCSNCRSRFGATRTAWSRACMRISDWRQTSDKLQRTKSRVWRGPASRAP